MTVARLELSREQILAQRRRAGSLDHRMPPGPDSLWRAAWAGLQDSMPRAALLSIHARVNGATASTWEDPSLVQLWGPRFSAYVVAAQDVGIFSLGRLPDTVAGRRRAEELAGRLDEFLAGTRMTYGEAGRNLGVLPNFLRYAAPTGRVLIRWEGARQPMLWTVPAPGLDPLEARLELARRYLHIFGPGTATGFGDWAGIKPAPAQAALAALEALTGSLVPAGTPVGKGWILASDEAAFRAPVEASDGVRLLPSGDTYFLLQGADRELLVPEPERRRMLWTPRVWPGALLIAGEPAGTWRRSETAVSIQTWRRLSPQERAAVEEEAASLPIPGVRRAMRVTWGE